MEQLKEFDLTGLLERMSELVSAWGLKVVGALVVFIVGILIAKSFRKNTIKMLRKGKRIDETLIPFFGGLVYYLLLTIVIIAVLGLFGIETTSFIAVIGAGGLAIGLALQGTLSNFSAGIMLLVFRPFKAGDFVETAGVSGSVVEIGIFSTILNTPDNVRLIVPNSAVYGQIVKNYTANTTRRCDLVVGISYGDNIGKATEVIHRILVADSRVLEDPQPQVVVGELADSSVNILVRPWCQKEDYWGLRFDLTRRFKEDLEAAGCSIPFPQSDVHLYEEKKNDAA